MIYGWMWIAVIVFAIIIEVITDELISIWFVPGAIAATIMDFCDIGILWQVLVVILLAGAGIAFARFYLIKKLKLGIVKTNIDAIIGERCVVTEKIDNYIGCGQVKIKGQIWSARGVGQDDVYDEGDVLHVVAIEGVKVICKK